MTTVLKYGHGTVSAGGLYLVGTSASTRPDQTRPNQTTRYRDPELTSLFGRHSEFYPHDVPGVADSPPSQMVVLWLTVRITSRTFPHTSSELAQIPCASKTIYPARKTCGC